MLFIVYLLISPLVLKRVKVRVPMHADCRLLPVSLEKPS